MKYRPGDVVRARDDLIRNAPYDDVGVIDTSSRHLHDVEAWCRAIPRICDYAGEWVTIKAVDEDFYITTEETGGEMDAFDTVLWAPGMFDDSERQSENSISETDLLTIID